MRFLVIFAVLGSTHAAMSEVKWPALEKPVSLVPDKAFAGWEGQIEKYWSREGNTIIGRNKARVPASTYLFTKQNYREFRLLLEVKQTRGKNYSTMHSAVAVLGAKHKDKGDPFGFRGPLLMFCNDWGIWDAHRRNRIYPQRHRGQYRHKAENVGKWNAIEVLVVGNRIRMVANGQLVIDFTDDAKMLQNSPIGLQLHSNGRPQEYRFRNIKVSTKPVSRLLTLKDKK